MEHNTKKSPESSSKKDVLKNKNTKNSDKKAASQNAIGEHEYEEDRSPNIRMKEQPFKKKTNAVPDRETDGI